MSESGNESDGETGKAVEWLVTVTMRTQHRAGTGAN